MKVSIKVYMRYHELRWKVNRFLCKHGIHKYLNREMGGFSWKYCKREHRLFHECGAWNQLTGDNIQ